METRLIGWEISDDVRVLDSQVFHQQHIHCYAEDNIDDISFTNEYVYNEDDEAYVLNIARPNQVIFTLKFKILRYGEDCANVINDLKSFFDQAGKEFTIRRRVTGSFPNKFVVDSIKAPHVNKSSEPLEFEVSCSYVGAFRNYPMRHRRVAFNGEEDRFDFPHSFDHPEPSTEFDVYIDGEYQKELNNNIGKVEGLIYTILVIDPFDTLLITNRTYEEQFKIVYNFQKDDYIVLDTESDETSFTLTRDEETIDLLKHIDFSVSSLPMLYQGINLIRIDLFKSGITIGESRTHATYWDRMV